MVLSFLILLNTRVWVIAISLSGVIHLICKINILNIWQRLQKTSTLEEIQLNSCVNGTIPYLHAWLLCKQTYFLTKSSENLDACLHQKTYILLVTNGTCHASAGWRPSQRLQRWSSLQPTMGNTYPSSDLLTRPNGHCSNYMLFSVVKKWDTLLIVRQLRVVTQNSLI